MKEHYYGSGDRLNSKFSTLSRSGAVRYLLSEIKKKVNPRSYYEDAGVNYDIPSSTLILVDGSREMNRRFKLAGERSRKISGYKNGTGVSTVTNNRRRAFRARKRKLMQKH